MEGNYTFLITAPWLEFFDFLGSELPIQDSQGQWFLRIDTGDNTSKDNYDDLLDLVGFMPELPEGFTYELWADHDTQIISFSDLIAVVD